MTAPKSLPLLLALADCGGSSSSGSMASSASATQTSTAQKPKPKSGAKQKANSSNSSSQGAPHSGPVPTDPNPLPNQGTTKAVAPGLLLPRRLAEGSAPGAHDSCQERQGKGLHDGDGGNDRAGSQGPLRSATTIHVLSLRVKGAQTFLIYRDGQGTPTALPMARVGGGVEGRRARPQPAVALMSELPTQTQKSGCRSP